MLAEWQAYEMHAGPIGTMYADVTQRVLIDLVRQLNYLTGAQYKSNPVPKPGRGFPDPVELITPPKAEEIDEETELLRREDEIMRFDEALAKSAPQPPQDQEEE